ncbi:hypothetical protein LINPERHAP1_LOCUS16017 [Linum perenne]
MFHCLFLTNFTSIVTSMGTKAALQVTGYVIPMAEEVATFTMAVEIGFDERDSVCAGKPKRWWVVRNR